MLLHVVDCYCPLVVPEFRAKPWRSEIHQTCGSHIYNFHIIYKNWTVREMKWSRVCWITMFFFYIFCFFFFFWSSFHFTQEEFPSHGSSGWRSSVLNPGPQTAPQIWMRVKSVPSVGQYQHGLYLPFYFINKKFFLFFCFNYIYILKHNYSQI